MNHIPYTEILKPELINDAILHTHEPFLNDYLVLHSLLKIYEPKSVLEIGTHVGEGTNIICNAGPNANVFSLDLPEELSSLSKQHPTYKMMDVGEICKAKYTQLLGDSLTFDYGNYEAWFIDGEHDYKHARHETKEAIKTGAKLIIWHDADMVEVWDAINDSFEWNEDYELFRVGQTRIAYAVKI